MAGVSSSVSESASRSSCGAYVAVKFLCVRDNELGKMATKKAENTPATMLCQGARACGTILAMSRLSTAVRAEEHVCTECETPSKKKVKKRAKGTMPMRAH